MKQAAPLNYPPGGLLDQFYRQFDPDLLASLRMEETPEEKAAREAKEKADKDGMFTQEQVNAIGSREKKEGRKAATKEILEKLGFTEDDLDGAVTAVTAWRKRDEDAKDEAVKAKEKQDADAAAAAKDKADAAREKRLAAAERRLLASGLALPLKKDKDGNPLVDKDGKPTGEIDQDAADKLLQRAIKNLEVDFDKDVDPEDLTAAITDLKRDIPTFFGGTDPGTGDDKGKGKGKGAPPPARPPGTAGSRTESQEKARSALREIFPDKVKSE